MRVDADCGSLLISLLISFMIRDNEARTIGYKQSFCQSSMSATTASLLPR